MAAVVDAFVAAYILNRARSAICRRCSTGAIGKSAFGTKQTLMPTMSMSAFGGKADFLIYAVVSATDPKRTVDLAAAYEAPTAKYV